MRPTDQKNTHFTTSGGKQNGKEGESPIRTEAAVKQNGTQCNDLTS